MLINAKNNVKKIGILKSLRLIILLFLILNFSEWKNKNNKISKEEIKKAEKKFTPKKIIHNELNITVKRKNIFTEAILIFIIFFKNNKPIDSVIK